MSMLVGGVEGEMEELIFLSVEEDEDMMTLWVGEKQWRSGREREGERERKKRREEEKEVEVQAKSRKGE